MIRLTKGVPHLEGKYEIKVVGVRLVDEGETDGDIFSREELFDTLVEPEWTGVQLYDHIC